MDEDGWLETLLCVPLLPGYRRVRMNTPQRWLAWIPSLCGCYLSLDTLG